MTAKDWIETLIRSRLSEAEEQIRGWSRCLRPPSKYASEEKRRARDELLRWRSEADFARDALEMIGLMYLTPLTQEKP